MKDIKISIEQQSILFKKHLDEQDNERIIFSAAFGAGKTYFLREFLDANSTEYLAIKLAPVNYSVASNEDIFKFIKFDILFQLLAHHGAKQPGKIKIRPDIFYGLKFANKADSFFTSIAGFFGALNKDVKEVSEVISTLAMLHSNASELINASPEEEENPEVNDFLKKMMASYYKEADEVTSFIELTLHQLSSASEPKEGEESKAGRKKVLVIDDLDRLDPEHIFRLFNVFSTHFDYNYSNGNKFGFDKVIFVCDIKNIRNIFHSRYGVETDFSGYIDKFFSQEIYYFSNENAIKNYIDKLLESIKIDERTDFKAIYFKTYLLEGANYREKWIAFWVLFELVVSGALKPRRIYSPHKSWVYPEDTITIRGKYHPIVQHINTVPTIVSIRLLSSILGGGEQLLHAVKHAVNQPRSIEYQNMINDSQYLERLTDSLLIIDYDNHKFEIVNESNQPKEHTYLHTDGRRIEYIIGKYGNHRDLYRSRMQRDTGITFFELLPIMIQKLLDHKVIK